MLNKFFRGVLMEEAGAGEGGAGGGGVAVMDAAPSTALVPAGTTDVALTTDHSTTDETDAGTEGGELATTEARALENGKPSQTTKESLALIKATNPQLAHAIPRALAVEQRLRSEFPGQNPFDAIKVMRREFKALGGEEGIAQIRQSLADIEEMDLLYAAGDPRMLDKMTASPEGKAAFTMLAPHVFDRFQKLAPNAFTGYMARVILGDMIGQRVDMAVQRLIDLIPAENTLAVAELGKVANYLKRLQQLEQVQPETPAVKTVDPEREKLEREKQELAKEKRELVIQGWKTAADGDKQRIFDQAWAAETKSRKITPIEREDIEARLWSRLPVTLKAVPGFSDSLKEFFENDDKTGYLTYLRSMHADKIPAILRSEIQRRLGVTPAAKATPAAATPATPAVAKGPVDSGFKRVGEQPPVHVMNHQQSRLIFTRNQAVLSREWQGHPAGTKVQWG
jgi:hypothetical protein